MDKRVEITYDVVYNVFFLSMFLYRNVYYSNYNI